VTTAIKKLASMRIVRYGVIGGISTLIHFLVAAAFLRYVSESLLWANVAGFLVAYIFSYTMQSLHVFGHALSVGKALRYFVVQFASLLASVYISDWLAQNFNVYVKTIFVIVLMPLITYVIHTFWTFAHE